LIRNETQRGKEILERNKQCQKMTTNKSQIRRTHTVNEITQYSSNIGKNNKNIDSSGDKIVTKIKDKR